MAFHSWASNLIANDTTIYATDIFVQRRGPAGPIPPENSIALPAGGTTALLLLFGLMLLGGLHGLRRQ